MTIGRDAVDLDDLANVLAGDPLTAEVRAKIKRAYLTQSCRFDLLEAANYLGALTALRQSSRGWRSKNRDSTQSALFRMAIILYARATVTRSKHKKGERGPSEIDKELNREQLDDHGAIVDVRSMAQAHVIFDKTVADELWHTGKSLLIQVDGGWRPVSLSQRVIVSEAMLARLQRQVPVAAAIMERRTIERLREVVQALMKIGEPKYQAAIARCRKDFSTFVSDTVASEFAKDGAQATEGGRTFFFDH